MAMLVWGMYEVWLWWVQSMWVVHVVQVLCLAQLTCYGWMWCVGWEELVWYVRCVCVWLGAAWVERGWGWVDERIGIGIYQSCGNKGSVGRVSVFGLRWCGWYRWGVGRGLGPSSGGVVLCLCELWVRIICVDGRSRCLYNVLGAAYLRIIGTPRI